MNNEKIILIVNDNQDILVQIKKRLLEKKFNIKTVLSGEEALKFLKNQKADLILLDYNLNHQNDGRKTAIDFIPKIKKMNPACPIVVTTVTENYLSVKDLNVLDIWYVNSLFWENVAELVEKKLLP